MGVQEQVLHVISLDQAKVDTEEVGEEESQVIDKLLFVVRRAVVRRFDIYVLPSYGQRKAHFGMSGRTCQCESESSG
jgi:hypothetical protein